MNPEQPEPDVTDIAHQRPGAVPHSIQDGTVIPFPTPAVAMLRWGVEYAGRHVAFHAWRAPAYGLALGWWTLRGAARAIAAGFGWVSVRGEYRPLITAARAAKRWDAVHDLPVRRKLLADYLGEARAVWTPGVVVTPVWVRQVTDCSRGLSSKVAAALIADPHSAHRTTTATSRTGAQSQWRAA